MLYKLLVVFMVVKLSSSYTAPIRCEDLNIPQPEKNELCALGLYLPRLSEMHPNIVFQDVQRRNAELSSALNFLYGNGENKFPGKRNPELSSALLSYLNRNGRNY
ncbi:uncharacterized protein LOC108908388 [Anoplophora glabripennis]|uniref:uncharacterized protein LOC108908388 n=1 Tax=Anoplophora glabripennis TaxID=217634 RepID=UPI0008750340|nr:uncharacterized protein LOC108908388 [Anoplophora glabripennis]